MFSSSNKLFHVCSFHNSFSQLFSSLYETSYETALKSFFCSGTCLFKIVGYGKANVAKFNKIKIQYSIAKIQHRIHISHRIPYSAELTLSKTSTRNDESLTFSQIFRETLIFNIWEFNIQLEF